MSKMVVCPYGQEARILPMQNITKQEVYDECYKMQKQLKALEIIKKHIKIVNGQLIFKGISYKKNIKDYELLKEVLL